MIKRLHVALVAVFLTLGGGVCCAAQSLVSVDNPGGLPDAPSALLRQTAPPAAHQEAPARISGIVSDIRGGLVPGATIKLQEHGKDEKETVTDDSGNFAFVELAPGTYTVLILAKGLETFLSEPINLKAGERFEVPDVALPAATSISVNVAANSSEVAEQELKLETHQRVLGVFPNFYTSFIYNAAPLNTKQKFKLSLRATLDPIAFITPAIVAGIEQANDTFPGWSTDTAGYFKRYGAAFGDAFLGRNIGSGLFPSIFHQDPRYFYMGPANPTKTRLLHALSAGVVVRGDNGHLQPNYSHILGNASAGAISTVYHPAGTGAGKLALTNALIGIGGTAVQCVLREFVFNHVTKGVAPYAKGKPADIPTAPADAPVEITPAPAPKPNP